MAAPWPQASTLDTAVPVLRRGRGEEAGSSRDRITQQRRRRDGRSDGALDEVRTQPDVRAEHTEADQDQAVPRPSDVGECRSTSTNDDQEPAGQKGCTITERRSRPMVDRPTTSDLESLALYRSSKRRIMARQHLAGGPCRIGPRTHDDGDRLVSLTELSGVPILRCEARI
ncbi:hypothetical protein [Kibdelosporangium philippinense]|uniref:hypothetical protein n=1 Tax=Kibdelosporangium philippinense TaxID=211113 RepID=UPI003606D348